ncbi:MAG: nucleotidyltransferase domain-containing protein [Nitrospirae bacterium]|nr:nucleotidyltransferase domain-containing protein [Nitrospirota bacterium]
MKDTLEKIRHILVKNKCVVFGYLFGSRVKGFAGIKSDWDVAVYFDVKCLKDWSRFYLEAEIEREIKEEVQVTVLNTVEEPVFAFEIINDGMVIADKDTEARILFESSMLRRHHDWDYFLKRHRALIPQK